MILPYIFRLICLSLASFFLVHFALGLSVSSLASPILAITKRFTPRSAASLLLAARLFPFAAAVLVVAAICVPSYLWLEPERTAERVGLVCLAAALLGILCWALSIGRGLRALRRSIQLERSWQRNGRETLLGETAFVVDGAGGMLALAGIFHPRLFISREVLRDLSREQLALALRHERAHQSAYDNLKRLILLLAPDIFPYQFRFFHGLEALERGWSRISEWAADDQAVAGNLGNSVSLAAALVRVARMGPARFSSPLMTSLIEAKDLEARVDRLLSATPGGVRPLRVQPVATAAILLATGLLGMMLARPSTLEAAHRLLEYLI